jgi:hypothetical protein
MNEKRNGFHNLFSLNYYVVVSLIIRQSMITSNCCGHDHMVVGFTTTCTISAYNESSWEFEHDSWRGVIDTICDHVCQWLAAGRWFSLGTPVSSTNKTNHHNITEILLKMVLNTDKPWFVYYFWTPPCCI